MLIRNDRNRWELPDGRELISGNMIELKLGGHWMLGRVMYFADLQSFVVAVDGGTVLVTEELEVRFTYDAYPKPQREDIASLWTVEDVAAYLRMLPNTVRILARRGELPGRHIGRKWRFRVKDILEWVDSHPNSSDIE